MITTCETIWRCWRVTHFALGSQTARWKYLIMRVILHVCSSHGENVTPRITSWTWRASRWKQFVRWKCSFCTMHNLHSSTHRQRLLFNQLYIEWSPSQRQRERRRDISNKRRSYTHIKWIYITEDWGEVHNILLSLTLSRYKREQKQTSHLWWLTQHVFPKWQIF